MSSTCITITPSTIEELGAKLVYNRESNKMPFILRFDPVDKSGLTISVICSQIVMDQLAEIILSSKQKIIEDKRKELESKQSELAAMMPTLISLSPTEHSNND